MSETDRRRKAIDEVAADMRNDAARKGQELTHEQCRQRVVDAARRRDQESRR